MSTKPPAGINEYPDDNLTKRIYSAIDSLLEIIPLNSDRLRLSFCINMFFEKKLDSIIECIEQANPQSSKIDYIELNKMIDNLFKEKNISKSDNTLNI